MGWTAIVFVLVLVVSVFWTHVQRDRNILEGNRGGRYPEDVAVDTELYTIIRDRRGYEKYPEVNVQRRAEDTFTNRLYLPLGDYYQADKNVGPPRSDPNALIY